MSEFDAGLILAAWLTGLAGGSGHCLGMCGGIVGALGVRQGSGLRGTSIVLVAHAGRVIGYAIAGAIIGLFGATIVGTIAGSSAMPVLRAVAAALVLLIGLQLLLGRPLLTRLERGGARIWRVLAPTFRRWLPPRNPLHGLLAGMLWGWLPCGLVYAQLTVAATSGSAAQGALLMVAFGIGTSVSLSVVSVLLQSLGLGRLPRQASGVLLIVFALWTVLPLVASTHPMH
jgi:sulfite exporter TauE/SafE